MTKLFNDFDDNLPYLLDDVESNLSHMAREIDTYNNNAINLSKALKTDSKKEILSLFTNDDEDETELAFYCVQECIGRLEQYMIELTKFIALFELFNIKANELNYHHSDKIKNYVQSIEDNTLLFMSKLTFFKNDVITALKNVYYDDNDECEILRLHHQALKRFEFAHRLKQSV